jgi:CO/xanthine dehydrogenase FAD-binding subunit
MMRLKVKEYYRVKSTQEAINLKRQYGEKAMYIAGGTDVIVGIKNKKWNPEVLISLNEIPGLSYIKEENGYIKIGALTTHRQIEKSPLIERKVEALMDAVKNLGSVQIRNVATIGGNLCNAAPSADTAPPLLVHNAMINLEGPEGQRSLPLEEFFLGPGKTSKKEEELLIEITMPVPPKTAKSAYWKHTRRSALELPIIGVALYLDVELGDYGRLQKVFDSPDLTWDDGLRALNESEIFCKELRLALGVAAPIPLKIKDLDGIVKGKRLNDQVFSEVIELALQQAQVRDSWRGAAWYRKEMIRVLTKRLALICLKRILKEV